MIMKISLNHWTNQGCRPKVDAQMAESEHKTARDNVGLLQNCFQDLLHLMMDVIGRIQRDAAIDPATVGPEAAQFLFKYEEIPHQAKEIVTKTLQIDALIDEAINETLLGKNEDEIFDSLKSESDLYEQSVSTLSDPSQRAKMWIGRAGQVLDLIASRTFGIQASAHQSDEDYSD
jgi:hypothetical protein